MSRDNVWQAWCVGARKPLGAYPTRQLARTRMLAEVGDMCEGGRWLYHSSLFTDSSVLADEICLVRAEDSEYRITFNVRSTPATWPSSRSRQRTTGSVSGGEARR